MRVGFIGIGLMGLPICQRLLHAGIDLQVWNRDHSKTIPLCQAGARAAASPRELAATVDVLLICVSDSAAVTAVFHGPDGVLRGAHAGLIVVDHSSITPDITRQVAAELQAQCGAHWIDAPVSGGVAGAEQGRLVIMAGGDASSIATLSPLLCHYSQRITRMGDVGAGQVTKICNQLIVAANSLLIAETVALAEQAGVDANLLAPALAGGFADSLPFQILTPRMAERRFEPVQWKVQTLLKDLGNAVALGQASASPLPLATAARRLLQTHADAGYASADLSSVILLHDSTPREAR
ncbi:MAG: NAD(P)-dependent oxidoreductase [Pseudomonadota bacterium]